MLPVVAFLEKQGHRFGTAEAVPWRRASPRSLRNRRFPINCGG